VEFSDVFTFGVGAGGSGALLLFFVKRWIDKIDNRLEDLIGALKEIEVRIARQDGYQEGQNKLIFAELKNQSQDITRLEAVVQQHSEILMRNKMKPISS